MKVRELIEKLKKEDPEAWVLAPSSDGFEDIDEIERMHFSRDMFNDRNYGPHEIGGTCVGVCLS